MSKKMEEKKCKGSFAAQASRVPAVTFGGTEFGSTQLSFFLPATHRSNIDLSASLKQADHEATLKVYRSKAGLRGFQGAMFSSVRLVYLD